MSEAYAVDFPKGAASHVDAAGQNFVRIHGADKLVQVAKLHFKNYQRVVQPRFAGH